MQVSSKKKRMFKSKREDLIFHWILLIWPILQFSVFYIGVNFNSFRLAFIGMDGGFTFDWFTEIFKGENKLINHFVVGNSIKRSVGYWAVSTAVSLPLSLFFSYYIFKKHSFSGFFKAVLFLPSILSSIVMVVLFDRFINQASVAWLHEVGRLDTSIKRLFDSQNYNFYIIAFNIWIGFGTNILIYSNSMSTISPEVIEAAELDGCNALREFFHIVIPHIYSTLTVFVVTGLATMFVNQYNLYSFFGASITNGGTIGYYVYLKVSAVSKTLENIDNVQTYHQYSAVGLLLTAIAIPLTFAVRAAMNKFGPSEE